MWVHFLDLMGNPRLMVIPICGAQKHSKEIRMSTLSATPMEAGKPSRRWGRSIGALVAGFLAVLIFSLGTDRAACAQDFSALGHAMAGGFVGLVLGIVGAAAWKRTELGPHWYPLALVVTALPCAWVVGKSGSGKFFAKEV
jgi:hypothetical protein